MNDGLVRIIIKNNFIEIKSSDNYRLLCEDVSVIQLVGTDVVIRPFAPTTFTLHFTSLERASVFVNILTEACVDLRKMKSGVQTDTITEVRECPK